MFNRLTHSYGLLLFLGSIVFTGALGIATELREQRLRASLWVVEGSSDTTADTESQTWEREGEDFFEEGPFLKEEDKPQDEEDDCTEVDCKDAPEGCRYEPVFGDSGCVTDCGEMRCRSEEEGGNREKYWNTENQKDRGSAEGGFSGSDERRPMPSDRPFVKPSPSTSPRDQSGERGPSRDGPWMQGGPKKTEDGKIIPRAGFEDEVRTQADRPRFFSDTDLKTPVGEAMENLAAMGIIGGFPDGTARAETYVNRAQAAKFLLLARFGSVPQDVENDGMFWDLLPGEWYVPYVVMAAGAGIISGNPDGSFRPGEVVVKAAFAKMLVRTFGLEENLPTDVPADVWYARYAGAIEVLGILKDLPYDAKLTRGDVALAIDTILSLKQEGKESFNR